MRDFFEKWYQYNAWANRKVIECLERQLVTDEKILSLLSHIISAQFIWLGRFKNQPIDQYPLWKSYPLTELKEMAKTAATQWNTFVLEGDIDRVLKYNNYTGQYFENQIEQIMIHLVNHGTYHRGQIALLLRQKGWEPVNTDYITYDRVVSGQLSDSY
jgi:uncharacterized damage-inducible protein DinB